MIARIGVRAVLLSAVVATIGCDRVTKHVARAALAGEPGRSYLADTIRLRSSTESANWLFSIDQSDMDALQEQDVPYGNNWDSADEAAAYGDAADQKRPWRSRIRDHIADRVAMLAPGARVLELGSGPGLLAHRVLQRCPRLESYTLVDFSEAMMALSRERLAAFPAASFVHASFKSEDWARRAGGPFDCVVSMQAVHELRHKRHAPRLYEQVYQVLATPGILLVCDHLPFDDSPRSLALYMTEEEQQRALADAGFVHVHVELDTNGLVLYAGERTA